MSDHQAKYEACYDKLTDNVMLKFTLVGAGEPLTATLTRDEFTKSAFAVEYYATCEGRPATQNRWATSPQSQKHEFDTVVGNCLMTEEGHTANQRFTQTIEQRLNEGWTLHGPMQMFPIDQPGWFKLVQPLTRIK